MRKAFVWSLLAVLMLSTVACGTAANVTGSPPAVTIPEKLSDLAPLVSISTPEQAEDVFFTVVKIVKKTSDAVEAEPRVTPADEKAYQAVRGAVKSFKASARVVYPAIELWRTLGDRKRWDLEAPKFITAAWAVITSRNGGG